MTFTAATVVRRSPNVVTRRQAGEVLLVPVRNDTADLGGFLFLLPNEVSTRTWELLESDWKVADLAARLAQEFDAEPDRIESDLFEFLDQLRTIGALETP